MSFIYTISNLVEPPGTLFLVFICSYNLIMELYVICVLELQSIVYKKKLAHCHIQFLVNCTRSGEIAQCLSHA